MSHTSGSAAISGVSQRHGSVMGRTTVETARTRTPHTAPAECADPASLSVGMAAASLRAGNVMWTMTVEITQTSLSMSAVSIASARHVGFFFI